MICSEYNSVFKSTVFENIFCAYIFGTVDFMTYKNETSKTRMSALN